MDARSVLLAVWIVSAWCSTGDSQVFVGARSVVQSPNFRITAASPELANQVAKVAEEHRKLLAMHWLGRELPKWPRPCPIVVNDGPRKPASGETKYTLVAGGVADFQMSVSGTPERIIDSVLPHEITHTIMASHFAALGRPVPRWADEGACTTVEHTSERKKHDMALIQYLGEGRGIPFATLFSLREYPPDMMPLYAQGYSLSCFLIAQGGPQRFIRFLERGMESDDWVAATDEYYQYPRLGKLQVAWHNWVLDGGGEVLAYTADAQGVSTRAIAARSRNAAADPSLQPSNAIAFADSQGVRTASALQPVGESLAKAARNPSNAVPSIGMVSPSLEEINKSMNPSTGSYYKDQFLRQQQSVSLPGPMQTIGGGTLYR